MSRTPPDGCGRQSLQRRRGEVAGHMAAHSGADLTPPGQWMAGQVIPTPDYPSRCRLHQHLRPPGEAAPVAGVGRTLPAPTLLLSSPPRSFWGCQCHRTLGQGQPRTGQAAEEVGARRMEGNPAESHFNPPGLCPCGPSAWSPLPRELCGPPTPRLMEFSTPTSAYGSSLNPV